MAEFWSNPGTEPKRGYRWIMRMNINGPNAVDEWLIKSVNRPNYTLSESSHVFINHTFYYPGRVQYNDLSVTLVDSVSPNAAVNMMNLLAASGYVTPDRAAEGDYRTISKRGWQEAGLGGVQIVQLDHDNQPLETWQFFNTWIKSCDLGQLSYDSDELLNISLTMRYDYFKIGSSAKLPNPSISSMFRA